MRAVLYVLEHEALAGPINVSSPGAVTNADFTRALGAVLHRPTVAAVPAFVLRLAVGEFADAALLASTRVVPEQLLNAGFEFRYPEIGEALRSALAGND